MVRVAVAGGTSPTLGHSIVAALHAAGHEPVILSRMPQDPASAPQWLYNAPVKYVSYDDVQSIQSAIAGADAVISVLKIIGEEANLTTHLNLLRASLATGTVKRFVPSDWSMYAGAHAQVDMLAHKATLLRECQRLAAASGPPDFEIAQFENGGFLNYFAQHSPAVTTAPELLGGLVDDMMLPYINIAEGVLPIPTDAEGRPAKISMTHLGGIGKYVAAAVSLPPGRWPRSGIFTVAGNTFTFVEVREILERDCGLTVKHETVTAADCERRKAEFDRKLEGGFDREAFIGGMVAQMQKVICIGERGGAWEENTPGELLQGVERVDLRSYLMRVWKGSPD